MEIGNRISESYEGRTATASHGRVTIAYVIRSIDEVNKTCECAKVEDDTQLMFSKGRIETLAFDYVLKHLNS
jgi:hypothetical protein